MVWPGPLWMSRAKVPEFDGSSRSSIRANRSCQIGATSRSITRASFCSRTLAAELLRGVLTGESVPSSPRAVRQGDGYATTS